MTKTSKNSDEVDENIKQCFYFELSTNRSCTKHAPHFREMDKYEVVSFWQTNTL